MDWTSFCWGIAAAYAGLWVGVAVYNWATDRHIAIFGAKDRKPKTPYEAVKVKR